MLSSAILIKSILGIIGSASLFYLVGYLFNYLLNKRKVYWGWIPTYFYLLSGMIISICAFAMFKTKGITILAFVPFLLVLVSRGFHQKFNFQEVKGFKKKAEPFLFLLISIFISYLYYLQGFAVQGDTIHYIGGDLEYYARVAENISCLGIENMRVEYMYPERFTVEPFHYADLWSIALVYNLSSIKPIFGAVLVAAPFFMGLSSLGLASLIHHFFIKEGRSLVLYLLAVAGLVGGFIFLFPSFVFPDSVDIYSRSMCNYTKLLWWASILPLFFIVVINKSDDLLVYLVFIVGLGYINVLPTLAMASYLWILFVSYKRESLLLSLKKMIIVASAATIFIYALYSFYPSLSAIQRPLTGKAVFSISSIISNIGTSINIFLGGFLQFSVYLPPLLLLIVHFWVEKVKLVTEAFFNLFLYSNIVLISSLFVWAILFTTTVDSVQFFFNVFVVVAGLFSALIYLYVYLKTSSNVFKVISIFLFMCSLISNIKYDINTASITKKERDELFEFVSSNSNATFAHYKELDKYTENIFSIGSITAMPYSILAYQVKHYENFSLNVPFVDLDSNARDYVFYKSLVEWAPMSHFIKMPENKMKSQDELMQKFMRQNKIGFLCLPIAVEIPEALNIFTVDSLFTPKLGWKIYRCDYEGNDTKDNF